MRGRYLADNVLLVVLIGVISGILLCGIVVAGSGFDEEFSRANDWDRYHGDVDYKTARLIQNVTRVLHQENMEILKQIEELRREVSELKEVVEGL